MYEIGLDWRAVWLFLGGACGGFLRAAMSDTQPTFCRKTFLDTVGGGAFGLLIPIFEPTVAEILPLVRLRDATPVQLGGLAFFMGGGGSWLWTTLGWRFGWIRRSGGDS